VKVGLLHVLEMSFSWVLCYCCLSMWISLV
jgi:hypothetical protein